MQNKNTVSKPLLHKKSHHQNGYQFDALCKVHPELSDFIIQNNYNKQPTINFSDSLGVKALNTALLKQYYNIEYWNIPEGYLCPGVPGRVDYIHYLADLLNQTKLDGSLPKSINVLDIGTGASCIYPILGQREYNWHFIASDIDPESIKAAKVNIANNKGLSSYISCRIQKNSKKIFTDIIKANEFYHLSMCNPPFHKSLNEAQKGSDRKWRNLNNHKVKHKAINKNLNFGGQKAELWCDGGELTFIKNMINESKYYQKQVLWFTCLVSKKDHLFKIKHALKKAKVCQIKVVNMAQGQKVSRFIAWSYFEVI